MCYQDKNSLEYNKDLYSIANIPGIRSMNKAVIEGSEEVSWPATMSEGWQK